jgi:drug/metabolite transporter (DMT)-like permease
MSSSTGPILAVGAIVLGNEVIVHGEPIDWRIVVGTGVAAGGLALVETWSPPVARGIAYIALITVLFARLRPNVPSPVESLLQWTGLGRSRE